ncbi:MAG: hypothetical protein HYV63_07840 [Candidatus Schekmanbacteria bacterium]|nr:hypothetical protein [Candidatus Schekmanbacteria bacterium]
MTRFIAPLLVLTLACTPVASAASSVPPFPSSRLALAAGVMGDFPLLRSHLDSFESKAEATYYVCVADELDRGNGATDYVDKVFDAWEERLDPARHVLIVASVKGGEVAIHAGSDFTALGFTEAAINSVIDSLFERPAKREGTRMFRGRGRITGMKTSLTSRRSFHLDEYGSAIISLITAVDENLAAREASAPRRERETDTAHERFSARLGEVAAAVRAARGTLLAHQHEAISVPPEALAWADPALAEAAVLSKSDPKSAVRSLELVADAMKAIERDAAEGFPNRRLALAGVEERRLEHRSLEVRIRAENFDTASVAEKLSMIKEEIAGAEAWLAEGRTDRALYAVSGLRRELEDAERTLAWLGFLQTVELRVLPGIGAGAVVILLLALWCRTRSRRKKCALGA